MARKGQSPQFLKKLRKKFKLGEFKKSRRRSNTNSGAYGRKREKSSTSAKATGKGKKTYFVYTSPFDF